MLYGTKGRITAGIAATAGVLTAATEAAQAANLVQIIPDKYRPILPAITIIALFLTVFSERIQGGASKPEVREAAQQSDNKNAAQRNNF